MVTMDRAQAAVLALGDASPQDCKELLGADVDCDAAFEAFSVVRDAMDHEPRVEKALEVARQRINKQYPMGTQRRSALIMLMAAQGTARQYSPVPFNRRLLDLLN